MSFNIQKLHFSIIFRTAKIHFSIKTAKQITKKMRKKTVSQSNFRHVNQYLIPLRIKKYFNIHSNEILKRDLPNWTGPSHYCKLLATLLRHILHVFTRSRRVLGAELSFLISSLCILLN